MKRILFVVFSCVLMALVGCSTVTKDIEVSAESDPKISFSGYKTYTWLGAAAIVFDEAGRWEPPAYDADTEIKFLIDKQLRARGMSESTSNPDLVVAFAAGIDMDNIEFVKNSETELETLKNIPKGALMVILVDASTGQPIWVGAAAADLQENVDVATAKVRLEYAVKEMFKKLPK